MSSPSNGSPKGSIDVLKEVTEILSQPTPTHASRQNNENDQHVGNSNSAASTHSDGSTSKQRRTYSNILLVGSGGREHAIVWKLLQSARLNADNGTIYCAPGNGGTATIDPKRVKNITQTSVSDLIAFSRDKEIELVVVGPEDPLNDGIVNEFNKQLPHVKVFGPTREAAQIECNKAFSKDFMLRHHIPTASYQSFTSFTDAQAYLQSPANADKRFVVKASGLAAGKGVIIPTRIEDAIEACREMLVDEKFGAAGKSIVIEEYLTGYETSVLAFVDGENIVVMPPAQDHKRLLNFDRGLNTGGMAAFAPTPNVSAELLNTITEEILYPAVRGMKADGIVYKGVLYAGIMVCKGRPFTLEFNARFGDPETQVLLPLLESDLIDIMVACVDGTLGQLAMKWKSHNTTASTIVCVSEGYPEAYQKGKRITGVLEDSSAATKQTNGVSHAATSQSIIFHAGTKLSNNELLTSGGRVLAVTSLGSNLQDATRNAYHTIEQRHIYFDGMYYRNDIGGIYQRPYSSEQPLRIGVLGSTKGTDLQYIIDAIEAKMLHATISVVISNKKDSGILERAQKHNIPAVHIAASKDKTREQWDNEAIHILHSHSVDIVLLIGLMRIISHRLIDHYYWRILNVHPSLLPEFAGGMDINVHEAVLQAKKQKTGCTIHFIDHGPVDSGPIVLQKSIDINPLEDTAETLKQKVQVLEGQAFIEVIQMYHDSKSFLTSILRNGGYPLKSKPLYKLYRRNALTAENVKQLVQRVNEALYDSSAGLEVDSINAELCYYIQFDVGITVQSLSVKERHALEWLLRETFEPSNLADHTFLQSTSSSSNDTIIEVGPRLSFTSAWSANAVSICKNIGLKVTRLEPFRRYQFVSKSSSQTLTASQRAVIEKLIHDQMTEFVVYKPLDTFYHSPLPPTAAASSSTSSNVTDNWFIVPLLEQGQDVLVKANTEQGLAMDQQDIDFYYQLFSEVLKRNPTNVELFDISQSNSEHSRHWFFRGKLIVDKQPVTHTLMDLVKATLKAHPDNSVVAFSDNSSAIRAAEKYVTTLQPGNPATSSSMEYRFQQAERHLLLTAETHNFPTGVAPFPGSATGTGGRIRDTHATGSGSLVAASLVGYSVGQLHIARYQTPTSYETFHATSDYPSNLATPLQIEIQASNGASDYGNKFGEPVVGGFTRSYGQRIPVAAPPSSSTANGVESNEATADVATERREYLKPIMFSAGIGFLDAQHSQKGKPEIGMLVVKIGGPAYRIGMGGSAASSMMSGIDNAANKNQAQLDFNAVQRGDAEMANKLNRVVRACVELGPKNPIISIHDQGAGGNCNVLKEIVDPLGGKIDIRAVSVGDSTLSVLELWGAEYQESDALLIKPESQALFTSICHRERCPLDYVGTVTGDGRVVVLDSTDGSTPVDLDLQQVLGNIPQKTFHLERKDRSALKALQLPTDITQQLQLRPILTKLFSFLSVGSKRFLTNKVDRSVTGLVAQQSCVGPLHTPLADVSVIATTHFNRTGVASAIGEQPIKSLISPAAMARLTVGEALTNLVFASITKRDDIKCSANWMWPAKLPYEGADLYDACVAMKHVMIELGVAVDGGKDSLSMAAKAENGEVVKAPGTLVVTLYAPCDDITLTVTPDLKNRGNSTLLYINMSSASAKRASSTASLGGSAFATIYNQLGNETADLHDSKYFATVFDTVQQLLKQRLLLSGHDVSDGGLLTAALEMSFAGNTGVDLSFNVDQQDATSVYSYLFGEDLRVVLEVDNQQLQEVQQLLSDKKIHATIIGTTNSTRNITITVNQQKQVQSTVAELRAEWERTSYEIEKHQISIECADSEFKQLETRTKDPPYHLTFTPQPTSHSLLTLESHQKPRVAVIREEGSNGDREMLSALSSAGFDAWDVHMQDLLNGSVNLLDAVWRGIVFVGGFSYGDVLDSAKGWAAVIKLHPELTQQFHAFKRREDTFTLGICNGCQLSALLGWVGTTKEEEEQQSQSATPASIDNPPARFIHNLSGRYESRWVTVRIEQGNPSVLLKNMHGSVLGCWVAHGEGTAYFPEGKERQQLVESLNLVPLRYVDDDGKATEVYPLNPNGSPAGIAGLVSPNGRHLALMPHPERCFQLWQWPYQPRTIEWQQSVKNGVSPWLTMFQNAYNWCIETNHLNAQARTTVSSTPAPATAAPPAHPNVSVNTSLPVTAISTHEANGASALPTEEKIAYQRQMITQHLHRTIHDTNFSNPALSQKFVGKVRDTYQLYDNLMVLVTTDRLSAFDRVLADIPYKGHVLNQVANWWFQQTAHIVPNHYVASPHPNVTIGRRCQSFAVEIVVRGYITGTTGTSLWTHYNKHGSRNYCGNVLPDGLIKNQKLSANIVTPTTKAEDHDVPISGEEIVKQQLMTSEQWEYVKDVALKLFAFGQETALKHGLLLVDTKYEFGIDPSKNNQITLIDEIHTPDSSRYWIASSYESRMGKGEEPENVDKEFLRLWYAANCDPYKDETLPTPPEEKIVELSRRYIQLFEMITGLEFTFPSLSDDKQQSAAVEAENRVNEWIASYERSGKQLPAPLFNINAYSSNQDPKSPRTALMDSLIVDLGGKII